MLKTGFILLAVILAIVLFAGASSVARRAFTDIRQQKSFSIKAALVLIVWLAYVSSISLTGIFANATFPPRIPLLLVFPAFAFFIYLFVKSKFRPIIDNTPASWPVYFQSFRIVVELLIWGSMINDILPKAASFEGYNFDIAIGITAPFVGYFLLTNGKAKSKGAMMVWNVVGLLTLAIVVFILISHAYFYSFWGYTESILNKGFGLFPYTFLAGFFMPLAVFMHIFSIIKTRSKK